MVMSDTTDLLVTVEIAFIRDKRLTRAVTPKIALFANVTVCCH
jgi:hypothetical protein